MVLTKLKVGRTEITYRALQANMYDTLYKYRTVVDTDSNKNVSGKNISAEMNPVVFFLFFICTIGIYQIHDPFELRYLIYTVRIF